MSRGSAHLKPRINDEHIESQRQILRELALDQEMEWGNPLDDPDYDQDAYEWIEFIETYEDAVEGMARLGIDPYDEPFSWIHFLDPLAGFTPGPRSDSADEARLLDYLAATYGRSA